MASSVDLKSAFDTDKPAEVATRLESLKTALNDAPNTRNGWAPTLAGFQAPPADPVDTLSKALAAPELSKAISAEVMSSITAQLATTQGAMADLQKDFTLTSPLSTGYVAYDLEAPAKILTPRPTPLRNRIPRGKGIGTAHRYKRITGFTGTGTGGVGNLRPGITDSTTNTFGSLSLIRGPKISYAGDEAAVPYLQFSLSDQVPWSAQFSGQGFQDIRQLSQTSLLYASMLMEERLMLGGRGTAAGFSGALATPTGTVTITARVAGTGEVGNSANIATLFVTVTAATQFGETVLLASASNTSLSATTGRVLDVQVPSLNVIGAQAYKVYIGTTAAAAAQFPAACSITNGTAARTPIFGNQVSCLLIATATDGCVTINFTGAGTGGMPTTGTNPPTVAADSSALDYDGILPIVQGANSGYVKQLGAVFGANPGDEYNQAFALMFDNNKADPDEILLNGNDRKQLSDLIKLNSNTSAYRISLTEGDAHQATIGAVVSGLQNEVTGKMVDLTVHPWLQQGISPILSWTLPIPDTDVSDVWKVFNVQDYMAVQWPVTQFAYEASTYWYGTFLCYAAAWNGCLTGIVRK